MATQNNWNNTVPSRQTSFNSGLTVATTGVATNATQPAFLATLSTFTNNVTGDGTVYTIPFNTELFDIGNNFNTGTFTFTAPKSGLYLFCCSFLMGNLGASHTTFEAKIVPSNFVSGYTCTYMSGAAARASGNFLSTPPMTVLHQLVANDTVTMTIRVAGSTKTVSMSANVGNQRQFNWFSAYLVC